MCMHMHMYHRRKRGQGEIVKLIAASARARAVARRRGPHGSAGPGPRASPGACALPLRSRLPLFFSPPPPQTPGPSQPAYPHHKFVHAFMYYVLHRNDTTAWVTDGAQRENVSFSLSVSLLPPRPLAQASSIACPPSPPRAPWPRPCHTSNRRSHARALSSRPALPHTLSPQAPVPLSHPSLR